jgi:acyl-homoserine lactone acylase PvdQ
MKRTSLFFLLLLLAATIPSAQSTVNGQQRAAKSAQAAKAGNAEILRDEFGVPHIFASTLEDAAFAIGYAQAEDRLEELLKNYRKAEGTMSEAFGQEWFRHDYRQRIWQHAAISRERYKEVSPKMRSAIEAYQQGIKRFMTEHPEQVPKWAPELHPSQIIALGRYIIWGWPEGEAGADLRRGGINPDPVAYRGSNQMLIAPSRTAMKAPIAVIDPHLGWYGEFRFYEVRIYAGDFNVSGVSILGIPFPSLGHSRWASIAMTTGGPDTSDVFEEELNPANPRQYKFKEQWTDMKVRKETIKVLDGDKLVEKQIEIEYTTHGPIVARKDGKAYSMAIPYFNEIGLTDQIYQMFTSRNLTEMKKALSQFQLMSQNIMVGTTEGDIFYLRNGRVPIRAQGCDPSKPMSGSGACEWQGIHPMSDLVQIANPPQGYMQNNNCSPFAMMKDSPLRAEKYVSYIYNDGNNPGHQRAAMTLEELHEAKNVNTEQAINIAFSTQVYKAEDWQKRILEPCKTFAKAHGLNPEEILCASIWNWKRHSTPDSEGAMSFYAFKMGFENPEFRKAVEVPDTMTDKDITTALTNAAKWMWSEFRSYNVPYGRYFRVGRQGGKTYPVGGGTLRDQGMATPRAISFNKVEKEMVGQGGQTSTQIVILTKTPQSFTVIPLGESDHKDSGHWDDQAEKLFSQGKAKSTYFLNKAELLKHVSSRKTLNRRAATAAK